MVGEPEMALGAREQPSVEQRRANRRIRVMDFSEHAFVRSHPELEQDRATARTRAVAVGVVDPELPHADHGVLVLHPPVVLVRMIAADDFDRQWRNDVARLPKPEAVDFAVMETGWYRVEPAHVWIYP